MTTIFLRVHVISCNSYKHSWVLSSRCNNLLFSKCPHTETYEDLHPQVSQEAFSFPLKFPKMMLAVPLYLRGLECQVPVPGSAAAARSSILPQLCLDKAKSKKIRQSQKQENWCSGEVLKSEIVAKNCSFRGSRNEPITTTSEQPYKSKILLPKKLNLCFLLNTPEIAGHFEISPALLSLSPSSGLETLVSKWNGFNFSLLRILLCWSSWPCPSDKALTPSSTSGLLPYNLRVEFPPCSLTWFCGSQSHSGSPSGHKMLTS